MWHLRSPRARRRPMRPVDPKIVEHLNDALTLELSVVNQYFLHARMLDNWGFPKLGKVFSDVSVDEMKDADTLISRVLLFEGHPNIQRLLAIRVGADAEEHADWFGSQVEALMRVGLPQYLAQQMETSGP